MLQYPLQPPPLSLSSHKPSPRDFDYPLSPLSISTNLPSSPSPTTPNLPRSPYLSSRQLQLPVSNRLPKSPSDSQSIPSYSVDDVLAPGDVVGEGFFLQGEPIRLVSNGAADSHHTVPAREFEVIKQLGTGSYAVVYLVQEVLSRPAVSEDGHMSTIGHMDFEIKSLSSSQIVYGRKYAIKCLSKADLDEEALAIQMSEVTIHQSLHLHPNIVTLHRTLETSAFLLLLLEYVPGQDLFYFLEQARDHHEMDNASHTDSSVSASHTPPTPSLLSNLHPSQLLSRTRLRLISSMFSQMCDAVAACHAQQVFHRDIKPENFIVTDGTFTAPDGRFERKVIVKLTDFGLSTTDLESADMDCGSAPYMSYECRNNVAPTYRPRAADVWSLGIVLINMLYHFNPWTDTAQGACSSFDLYLKDPVNFFMQRFMGMTRPVAEVLANKVFCILPDPQDDSPRMTAAEFGAWSKNLPNLLGAHAVHRTVSNSSQGHRISLSLPMSHRPSSRQASGCTTAARTPAIPARSLSRAPSLGPAFERVELSTVIDQDNEDEDADGEIDIEGMTSRSTSTNKRRKRGARKGKGANVVTSTPTPQDSTLATLAVASQSLAREISKASRSSSHRSASITASSSRSTRMNFEPVSMYAMPTALITNTPRTPSTSTAAVTAAPPVVPSPVTKKPSKWKLSFGKSSASSLANAAGAGRVSPVEEVSPPPSLDLSPSQAMATTASNVTSLLMGLNAPPPNPAPAVAPVNKLDNDASSTWSRGRRARDMQNPTTAKNPSKSPGRAITTSANHYTPSNLSSEPWTFHDHRPSERAVSPNSTRSGRPVMSSASSVVSSNWRSSMSTSSSAGTSTSAFTRYSNSSARSISTTATSVSSASWRTSVKPSSTYSSSTGYAHGHLPKNIKIMDGVPWELDQLPRGQHPNPVGDIFGSPPVRKQRTRKPKDLKLDTITERPVVPATSVQKSPGMRRDASTSTTDLSGPAGGKEDVEGVKKVQKGQINALAKMLSALRR
ncbi:Negative regulator of sexual conjugation and meiosis [Psilocybe cubensis]|uniref:Negative regulator of sexual conjugation and meiosis n=1 Tax=Psilocybe cubensis TaxID=181762 RepID=A0ACB8HBQ3_PSICU|nr:Negative regulator of sexual conjugation and meiosis [Psilocybe cubensis]KAH9485259.1 Negative regulator of sexual conjugation and meiosis [Psilocybe cubensis]